jgi:hypothetical protein
MQFYNLTELYMFIIKLITFFSNKYGECVYKIENNYFAFYLKGSFLFFNIRRVFKAEFLYNYIICVA